MSTENFTDKVPYDDCLNNLGWKMNDFLTKNGAVFDGHVFNNMKIFLRECIAEWLAAHPAALVSPQVAPALIDKERLAVVQERLHARGVRSIHFAWNEGAPDKSKEALTRSVITNLEKLLDGDCKIVNAAPAPVAPTPAQPSLTAAQRTRFDHLKEAHKHMQPLDGATIKGKDLFALLDVALALPSEPEGERS